MSEPAAKKASYEDLYRIPENKIGEIIDGQLVVTPRPSGRHSNAASILGGEIIPPFRLGRGGPGGWIILFEHEIMLGENLLVPDFSGWKKERFPAWPQESWISVAPDWVCEILSPSTARADKVLKMPIYAQYQVHYLWLVDPMARTLDAFRLESGNWVLLASFAENDKVRIEPFEEIELALENLWID